MQKKKRTARKTIETYIKHEDIIDNAVELGEQHNLNVEATDNNDSKGDIRVAKEDSEKFFDLLKSTIDKNQARRDK